MTDEKSEKGFKVVDRRIKDEDETAPSESAPVAEAKAPDPDPGPEPAKTKPESHDPGIGSAPPVSFPTFLLSLHASALIHLGLLPAPGDAEQAVDLAGARQNIDLLEVLKDKTKGNLTPEEDQLIENILYELRMLYLQGCRSSGAKECKE